MADLLPKIDYRNQSQLENQLRELALQYCSEEWPGEEFIKSDLLAETLFQVFSKMTEIIIQQLNRVPEKNFLTFLDLVGVSLLPPGSARTAICFNLVKGAKGPAHVPGGTQISSDESPDGKPVIFETDGGLDVIRPGLFRAISISPDNDKWRDHSGVLFDKECAGTETLLLGEDVTPHRLYLGHKGLFAFEGPKDVALRIELVNSYIQSDSSFEVKWFTFSDDLITPVPLEIKKGEETASLKGSGEIIFSSVDAIPEVPLKGFSISDDKESTFVGRWIFAELSTPLPGYGLPRIASVKAMVSRESAPLLQPEKAFSNNFPLDTGSDFFPFGERPVFNDKFYISSSEAFRRKDAAVTISVTLSDPEALPTPVAQNISLVWEFWDGERWEAIATWDSTGAFTSAGSITFTCPAVIPSKIGGEENYWIRVRIAGGNYGEEGKYVELTETEKYRVEWRDGVKKMDIDKSSDGENWQDLVGKTVWEYMPGALAPPSVKSLEISYVPVPEDVEDILTYNDFRYDLPKGEGSSFFPFQPMKESDPSLYLAFDESVSGLTATLFFPFETDKGLFRSPVFVWEYWNGQKWLEMNIEDGTENLTMMGIVRFIAPADMKKNVCFGERLHWMRARLAVGEYEGSPAASGLFTNAVWARNRVTVEGELLGSGNGAADQNFTFANSPVLPGETILVREAALTAEDREKISSEDGDDAIEVKKDEAGNILEIWVRWQEVGHFNFSTPNDRHYVINRSSGYITFGNGEKGMMPEAGKNNIKCGRYRWGGGKRGNLKKTTLTKLRTTIPYIGAVENPLPADGGSDQEGLDSIKRRGPQTINHRDRCVTKEDFERLAMAASGSIVRAKCFEDGNSLKIIIVPGSEDARPSPSAELKSKVRKYLLARRLCSLFTGNLCVESPVYREVRVTVDIAPKSLDRASPLKREILKRLDEYLHPLRGGPDGKGWEFGRGIFFSDIYSLLEDIDEVDHAANLSINDGTEDVKDLKKDETICSGMHVVTMISGN